MGQKPRNSLGAMGTMPSPMGKHGSLDGLPGSLWHSDDLRWLMSSIDTLQYDGTLNTEEEQILRKTLCLSARVYARRSRYANWGDPPTPRAAFLKPSFNLLESLVSSPFGGNAYLGFEEAKQALRRLFMKKKLTFLDEQRLQEVRDAIHQHLRYVEAASIGAIGASDVRAGR